MKKFIYIQEMGLDGACIAHSMGTIGKYIDTKITFKKNNKNLVEDACNLYALPVKFRHSRVLVHLSRRLKCTIVIMRCPSFVRPSSLTFHISTSPLKLLNRI